MSDNALSAVAGAVVGLLLGGLLADRATELAATLVAWGTLGGLVLAGYAALHRWPVSRWTAFGGLAGVAVGGLIAIVDALFF